MPSSLQEHFQVGAARELAGGIRPHHRGSAKHRPSSLLRQFLSNAPRQFSRCGARQEPVRAGPYESLLCAEELKLLRIAKPLAAPSHHV